LIPITRSTNLAKYFPLKNLLKVSLWVVLDGNCKVGGPMPGGPRWKRKKGPAAIGYVWAWTGRLNPLLLLLSDHLEIKLNPPSPATNEVVSITKNAMVSKQFPLQLRHTHDSLKITVIATRSKKTKMIVILVVTIWTAKTRDSSICRFLIKM
jgi:hypothetical protein